MDDYLQQRQRIHELIEQKNNLQAAIEQINEQIYNLEE